MKMCSWWCCWEIAYRNANWRESERDRTWEVELCWIRRDQRYKCSRGLNIVQTLCGLWPSSLPRNKALAGLAIAGRLAKERGEDRGKATPIHPGRVQRRRDAKFANGSALIPLSFLSSQPATHESPYRKQEDNLALLSLSLYAYNFNVYLLFHQLLGKMRRFRFFLFFVVVLFAGYNQRPEMERIHLIKEEYSQHGASGYTMEMT